MYVEVVPVHGHRALDESRGAALGAVRDDRPEEGAEVTEDSVRMFQSFAKPSNPRWKENADAAYNSFS